MQVNVEYLSFIMTALAGLSTFAILFTNFYFCVRQKFLKTVNCWFCNQYTKVPYDNRNSWDCPSCQQYNGFNQNGDYNKLIPAQHDELLNYQIPETRKNTQPPSNGLCSVCNNNQQLKIHQIANFIPLREDNYDVEIDHFQKQLERAYKLCPRCDKSLKKTLQKQNRWLLGLKLLRNRLQKSSIPNAQQTTIIQNLFLSILRFSLFIIAILHSLFVLYNIEYTDEHISQFFPKVLQPYIYLIRDLTLVFINIFDSLFSDSILSFIFINYFEVVFFKILTSVPMQLTICGFGFVSQICHAFLSRFSKKITLPCCAAWILIIVLTDDFAIIHSPFAAFIQLCATFAIVAVALISDADKSNGDANISKVQLHKMKTSPAQKTCASYSENEYDISFGKSSMNNSFDSFEETLRSSTPDYKSTRDFSPTFEQVDSNGFCKPQQSQHIFGQGPIFENALNKSPTSFRDLHGMKSILSPPASPSSLADSSSVYSFNSCIEVDLNKSLNELHLGFARRQQQQQQQHQQQQQSSRNFVYGRSSINDGGGDVLRPRPVLSPSRLQNITQNSWVAGGYWKAEDGAAATRDTAPSLSRSSSQSSGYGSTQALNSLPSSSRNNSVCGGGGVGAEIDRFSLLSEPVYCSPNPNTFVRGSHLLPHHQIPIYPVLRHDAQVFIQPRCYQQDTSFLDGTVNFMKNGGPPLAFVKGDRHRLWNESNKKYSNHWSTYD